MFLLYLSNINFVFFSKDNCGSDCVYWTTNYLAWGKPGIARFLVFMGIQSFVSFTILLFIDYRIISKFWYFIGCSGRTDNYLPNNSISAIVPIVDNVQIPNIAREDEDVAEEAKRIKDICNQEIEGTDVLVLNQVEKIYHGAFHAVDQISLGVKQGECFGLLGVNGA